MPFTASHPALVLPLVRPLRPAGVPPAALVIGSMTPDLLYYLPFRGADPITHTLIGVLTVDLATGVVVFLLWRLAGPAILAVFVPGLQRRFGAVAPRPSLPVRVAGVLFGLIVGSLTHLLWDSFTHAGWWAVDAIPWLAQRQGPLPGYEWMQYLGGAAGLLAMAIWAALWWRRRAAEPTGVGERRRAALAWCAVILAAIVGAVLGVWSGIDAEADKVRGAMFLAATRGCLAGALTVAAIAFGFAVSQRRGRIAGNLHPDEAT